MKLVTRQPIEWDDQRSAIIVDIGSGLHALHQVLKLYRAIDFKHISYPGKIKSLCAEDIAHLLDQ